jgi:bifunctional DNA-binding transcriptional regulator/antitoxin component of YhaV-PrlF toxin-antitoxin module
MLSMIKKTLQPTNDLYIQFTDEEVAELGWEPGQKLEVKQHDDGSIELRPYQKVELDIEEWPKELLYLLIKESLDNDISVNDVINNLLKEALEKYPLDEDSVETTPKELLLEKQYAAAKIDPNFTNNDTSICNSVV